MTTLPDPQAAFNVPSFRPEMFSPYFTEDMIRCIRSDGSKAEYDDGVPVSTTGQCEADRFVVLTGSMTYLSRTYGRCCARKVRWPTGSRKGFRKSAITKLLCRHAALFPVSSQLTGKTEAEYLVIAVKWGLR